MYQKRFAYSFAYVLTEWFPVRTERVSTSKIYLETHMVEVYVRVCQISMMENSFKPLFFLKKIQ